MCIVLRPMRDSRADEVIDPSIAAIGIAIVATPQASGLKPRPAWYMTLSAIIIPPIAPMNPVTTAKPATYGRRRRIEGSTSGARPRRARLAWSAAKAMRMTAPAARSANDHSRPPILASLDERVDQREPARHGQR